MEPDFWLQRWQDKQTGCHQRDINPHLATFWSRPPIEPGEQVFVPLSGKSLDMLWLRERYSVLGVTLSPVAVEDFYETTRCSLRIVGRAHLQSVRRIISACCAVIILICSPLSYSVYPRATSGRRWSLCRRICVRPMSPA